MSSQLKDSRGHFSSPLVVVFKVLLFKVLFLVVSEQFDAELKLLKSNCTNYAVNNMKENKLNVNVNNSVIGNC